MSDAFMAGGGVAGQTARAVDWSSTPLGSVESWSASLRAVVGMLLHSRHPMFLWWGPELIQFYNDAYLPSFGTGKHPAAMGQPGRACWPEIWPIIGPQIDSVMTHGDSTWHEDQLIPILRNGTLEDVYWTYGYSPVFDETGIAGTLVVITETTGRVIAERRLEAARLLTERTSTSSGPTTGPELFAGMAADIPFALVFTVDAGALGLSASFGLNGGELAAATAWFGERARVLLHRRGASSDDAGEVVQCSFLVRGDVPTDVYFAALRSAEHGGIIGFVALGVAPTLPLDRPYLTYLAEVTRLLAITRVQELDRERERRQRDQRVVSDRMVSVGTLASGIAHEINNPLTLVTANLEVILEQVRAAAVGELPGRSRELEEMVLDAKLGAERVTTIVQGLRTFSRADEERRAVIDVRPVLELSIDMAFHEIRHRARLRRELGPIPRVEADEARLGQVFINLLVNAAQALPRGNVDGNEIRIATFTDATGRAVITIHDSGPGIPADVVGRIFDPFFTTKDVGEGTGLGLSIAHNIVVSIGGELTVTTDTTGTTFRVALPAAQVTARTPSAPSAQTTTSARRATVLVVDDEPAICVALGRILSHHDVTTVATVHAALTAIESGKHFDVILSDLMMPDVSGMEFYDQIEQRFPRFRDRMVFVTGGAFTTATRDFLERIPNERMTKPFNPKVVRALVERFLASG